MKSGTGVILKALRIFFGIFMIVVYFGMAYLLFINFFDWSTGELWTTLRMAFAAILAIYGIYRCYRQVKGIDYYRLRDLEERFDQDDDEK